MPLMTNSKPKLPALEKVLQIGLAVKTRELNETGSRKDFQQSRIERRSPLDDELTRTLVTLRKIDKNVSALAKDAHRQEMALIGDDNLELSWPSDDEIFEHLGHL